jgi:hypothetical protein
MPVFAGHTVGIADGNEAVYNASDCMGTCEIDKVHKRTRRIHSLIY